MGRGKALKTKIREKKALTKAELQATKEWEERASNFIHQSKKQLLDWAKSLKVDPLELAAVLAATPLVYGVLRTSEEMLSRANEVADTLKETPFFGAQWVLPFFTSIWNKATGQKMDPGEEPSSDEEGISETTWWLISFVIAFVLIRHPEVITTMFSGAATGILGLGKLMLGVV